MIADGERGVFAGALSRLRGGWGTAASLAILLALWEIGHRAYGPVVLPSPAETLAALWRMTLDGRVAPALLATSRNALAGFVAAVMLGGVLGTLAGFSEIVRRLLQPVATLALGIPAVAWVVLALLWFGAGRAIVFTVLITCAPIVFAAAAAAVGSVDPALVRMARAFRAPFRLMVADVYLPHMLSHLFPAAATALALAFKVAVMTELLSGAGGIGDGLAAARAQVDTAAAMAWVLLLVALLLAIEHLVLEPLRHHLQAWRTPASGGDAVGA